jgi:Cu(I)/Ag(I) efflux system periplasmic protein CusF
MKLIQLLAALPLLTAASTFSAQAQTPASQAAAKSGAALTSAEVVDIYPKDGKVLLKHGPIPNIAMGAMTMEFGLKDKKALTTFRKGDKVRFAADQVKGEYVVTHIETAK